MRGWGLLASPPVGAELVDASGLPERVKLTKSPREIEYLRRAARFADAGLRAAIDVAGEGQTDNDVATAAVPLTPGRPPSPAP